MPHTTLLTRIRGEYLEMPGLRLTLDQAQRLFGADSTLCKTVLDALVEMKFLCVKPSGVYARLIDSGDIPRPRAVKAQLEAGTRVAMAPESTSPATCGNLACERRVTESDHRESLGRRPRERTPRQCACTIEQTPAPYVATLQIR